MSETTSSASSLASSLPAPAGLACLGDEPLGDRDWAEVAIARICLWGEDACQALIIQTKNGKESGSAHRSITKTQLKGLDDHWTMVEQPLGYVTRLSGYHSIFGTNCLLHSVKFEFASGQVVEVQGNRDDWKGEAFVVEDLADNFYLSSLEFEKGVCIGYKGYSTDVPLHDLMADESEPDIEKLEAAQNDSDRSDDDSEKRFNTPRNKKRGNNTKTNNYSGGGAGDDPPNLSDDEDDDENGEGGDGDGWAKSQLPAKEIPKPKKEKEWMVAYVCLCGGWSLYGSIFLYYNGCREGILLHSDQSRADIYKDVDQRGGTFVEVEQPGGNIVRISGYRLITEAEDPHVPPYLCHSLKLEFASGQIIESNGENQEWKGKFFSYDMPEDFYPNLLYFGPGGRLKGVRGIRTDDMDTKGMQPPHPESGERCCSCLPCC